MPPPRLQFAARPADPAGMPPTAPSGSSVPPGVTVKDTICNPRLANTCSWPPPGVTAMSTAPALGPVRPAALAISDSWPLPATPKLLTLLVAALAEKALRPLGVTAIQHAAPWPLGSEAVTTRGVAECSPKR